MRKIKSFQNNFKFKFKYILLLSFLFLSIGYASLSTTLDINGKANLALKLSDLNIYIGNFYVEDINKFDSIADDLKTVTLVAPKGDTNVTLYIANNATEYDEKISIKCNELDGVSYNYTFDETVYAQQINDVKIKITNTNEEDANVICVLSNEEIGKDSSTTKVKKVFFASDGYKNETPYKIITATTYGELPALDLDGRDFTGWYNANEELIISTATVSSTDDEILYASASSYQAKYISFENTLSSTGCDNAQCMLEEVDDMLN